MLFYPEASRRVVYFQQRTREKFPAQAGIYESTRRESQKPPMRRKGVRGCFASFSPKRESLISRHETNPSEATEKELKELVPDPEQLVQHLDPEATEKELKVRLKTGHP